MIAQRKRIIGNKKLNELNIQRVMLKKNHQKIHCKLGKVISKSVFNSIENEIQEIVSEMNTKKIKEILNHVTRPDGEFNQMKFWKIKKSLFPDVDNPLTAKRNDAGNLIKGTSFLLSLYRNTYSYRL